MLDALKNLFENNVVSEEIRADIERAWDAKITENREQVSKELREEFAQKYEHDKSVMVEAVDRMLSDQLSEEIAQFVEDRKQLAEERARVAVKAKQTESLVNEFVATQLASEIKELHEDQKLMSSKFKTLEAFVVEALAEEIAEFHAEKQNVVETKVRLVREGRAALDKVKEQFVKRAAKLVESTVSETLSSEITQLKEDIEAARRNDFGRKLFEAFASEYQTSYLNETSEAAKLLKVIDSKNAEIAEAKNAVVKAQRILESKAAEINTLQESKERQALMHEMLAPLSKTQKAIMSELLESVQTSRLQSNFEKYLPAVISGDAPKKKKLVEAKEVTGDKSTLSVSSSEDNNIVDIRRLAGIKH